MSYHLRRPHETGLSRIAEEVVIRGGRAKRYRYDPDSVAGPSPDREDHLLLGNALGEELRRRTAVRKLGTHGEMTDTEVWVDPHVWQAALHHVHAASELLHRSAKPPRTPGTVRVMVRATISLFGMDTRR